MRKIISVLPLLFTTFEARGATLRYVEETRFDYQYLMADFTFNYSPNGGFTDYPTLSNGVARLNEPHGYPENSYSLGDENASDFIPHAEFGFVVNGFQDKPFANQSILHQESCPVFRACSTVFNLPGTTIAYIFGNDFYSAQHVSLDVRFDSNQDVAQWNVTFEDDGDGNSYNNTSSSLVNYGFPGKFLYDRSFDQLGFLSGSTAPGTWVKTVQQECYFIGSETFDEPDFVDCSTPSPIPLPASLPLLLAALGGIAVVRARRK